MLKGMNTRTQSESYHQAMDMSGQTENIYSPVVQARLKSTLGYFGAGITFTGIIASTARGSRFAAINPLWFLIPCIGSLMGTLFTSQENAVQKHLLFGSFTLFEGLSLAPLVTMAQLPILFNALGATGVMMAAQTAYAYTTPTTDFLSMGGVLGVGLCAMIGVSVIGMFYPSPLLMNLYIYGGLLLFGGFVLYDT